VGFCACLITLACATSAAASGHGSVVLVDTVTSRVVANLPLGVEPMRISYGAGAFWVVAPHEGEVVRVDPKRRALERHAIPGEPYDAAFGAGSVWIPRHDGFDVVALRRGSLRRSAGLGPPQLAVACAFGAVWLVGADGVLRRLDPRSLRVTGTVDGVAFTTEGFEPKIAATRDALWISDAVRNAVVRVDPRRLRVTSVVAHGGNGVAVAAGTVWSTDGSYASRVAGGRVLRLKTGSGPFDVATDGRSIWVVNRFSRTLVRIEPKQAHATETIRIPGRAAAVAYGRGYVAVALF
jgi:streptogramin lyase